MEVPMFHPLERTAITCTMTNGLDLESVTSRISRFLRLKSIESHYHDDCGRVDAQTDNLVKFVIQLWKSNNNDAVIVEIQRRQGCCIAMQALRHDLIQAIQQGIEEGNNNISHNPHTVRRDGLLLQRVVTTAAAQSQLLSRALPPQPPGTSCLESAMELTINMLSSDRVDAQRLGLESLCVMTDPTKVLLENAVKVSRSILLEEEESNHIMTRLLKRYFVLQRQDFANADDDVMMSEGNEFFGAMHLLALKVLSQSLECLVTSLAGEAPSLLNSSSNDNKDFWATIVSCLYQNVQVASTKPMEASYAIRCLRFLQMIQPEMLDYSVQRQKEEVLISLIHAHDYGRQHHRLLEHESQLWMGRLGLAH